MRIHRLVVAVILVAGAAARVADADPAQCNKFLAEIAHDKGNLQLLLQIAHDTGAHWSSPESGKAHIALLEHISQLCAKPEYAGVDASCQARAYRNDLCTNLSDPKVIIKKNVLAFAAFQAKNFYLPKPNDGFLESSGPTTWAEMFSPAKEEAKVRAQVDPVAKQAGVEISDDEMFPALHAAFAALADKVRELAPTWELPGAPCTGVACDVGKRAMAKWYPKAKLLQFREDAHDWKIAKTELGVPTHRYKDGFILLQVPGEEFCQLRAWSVSEPYAGGGQYQAASGATIGYVRWQTCK